MSKIEQNEVLLMALEALENYGIDGTKSVGGIKCTEAITALREALAEQAEQEPVAWNIGLEKEVLALKHNVVGSHDYTQGRWDLLGEVQDVIRKHALPVIDTCDSGHKFAKLPDHPKKDGKARCPHCIASGLDAAKAHEQAEQSQLADATLEPVGYFAYDEEHDIWEELTGPNAPGATKLYAAPVRTKDPCNPLQDLTDDEIENAMEVSGIPYYDITNSDLIGFARAVIAADREKNK